MHCAAWPALLQINDRYVFPEQLDLDFGYRRFLSMAADPSVRNLYKLHSVLVHSMVLHSGGVQEDHYCAFIRPDGKQWLKFDDDKVSPVPLWQYSQGNLRLHVRSPMNCRTKEQTAQAPALILPTARQPAQSLGSEAPCISSAPLFMTYLDNATLGSSCCRGASRHPSLQQITCRSCTTRANKVHAVDVWHDRMYGMMGRPLLICSWMPVASSHSTCSFLPQAQPVHKALRAGCLHKPHALCVSSDRCHPAMPVGDQGHQGSCCG